MMRGACYRLVTDRLIHVFKKPEALNVTYLQGVVTAVGSAHSVCTYKGSREW